MLYGSPDQGLTERGAMLMTRSATWLARYRQILPGQPEEHYTLVTLLAVATFEDSSTDEDPQREANREEAIRFVQHNWQAIEQAAMFIEVNKDIEDLGKP